MKPGSLYFLAVIPSQEVREEVMGFKQEVAKKFESKAALRSPPHITLHMPFRWNEDKEESLIQKLGQFPYADYPIEIALRDFGFFPPRVVYVNVVSNDQISQLQKQLATYVRRELNVFNADYKDRAFNPHMTIAFRDLKKSRFLEAQSHYSDKKYEAVFEVNKICLLKHDGMKWNEHIRF